jgi:hypothetical protein
LRLGAQPFFVLSMKQLAGVRFEPAIPQRLLQSFVDRVNSSIATPAREYRSATFETFSKILANHNPGWGINEVTIPVDGLVDGTSRKGRLDFPQNLPQDGFEIEGDELAVSALLHNSGTASRLAPELCGTIVGILPGPALVSAAWFCCSSRIQSQVFDQLISTSR